MSNGRSRRSPPPQCLEKNTNRLTSKLSDLKHPDVQRVGIRYQWIRIIPFWIPVVQHLNNKLPESMTARQHTEHVDASDSPHLNLARSKSPLGPFTFTKLSGYRSRLRVDDDSSPKLFLCRDRPFRRCDRERGVSERSSPRRALKLGEYVGEDFARKNWWHCLRRRKCELRTDRMAWGARGRGRWEATARWKEGDGSRVASGLEGDGGCG